MELLNSMYGVFALKYRLLTQYVIKCKANRFFYSAVFEQFGIPNSFSSYIVCNTHACVIS